MPPYRMMASRGQIAVSAAGHSAYLEVFNFLDTNHAGLRDLAYVLKDAFDVSYADGRWAIDTSSPYNIVGGEMRISSDEPGPERAVLGGTTLIVNGIPEQVISYTIRGEDVFRIRDITDIIGLRVEWIDGVLYFFLTPNPPTQTSVK